MNKYRIKEFDPVNDIWILQKKVFKFFWISQSAGSKKKLQGFIDTNQPETPINAK